MKDKNRWDSKVRTLTIEQGREKLNATTVELFGMTWEDFITAFDAGQPIDGEHTDIMSVVTLRTLAGR